MFQTLFPNALYGFIHDADPRKFGVLEATRFDAEQVAFRQKRGYGVFFTPNSHGDTRNPDGSLLRWDGNVTRFNACFADFDKGKKEDQMALIRSMPLPPSIIVESKRGYHTYWMIKPVDSTKEVSVLWRAIQREISIAYGSDRACVNPSRLMRLPDTQHLKNPNEPFVVRIFEVKDTAYTLEDLEIAFQPKHPVAVSFNGLLKRGDVRLPLVMRLGPGDRHPTMIQVAGRLYRGRSPADYPKVREVLKVWYALSCVPLKRSWEEEVEDICRWIEKRQ